MKCHSIATFRVSFRATFLEKFLKTSCTVDRKNELFVKCVIAGRLRRELNFVLKIWSRMNDEKGCADQPVPVARVKIRPIQIVVQAQSTRFHSIPQ